jgi:hypothetical protein
MDRLVLLIHACSPNDDDRDEQVRHVPHDVDERVRDCDCANVLPSCSAVDMS